MVAMEIGWNHCVSFMKYIFKHVNCVNIKISVLDLQNKQTTTKCMPCCSSYSLFSKTMHWNLIFVCGGYGYRWNIYEFNTVAGSDVIEISITWRVWVNYNLNPW